MVFEWLPLDRKKDAMWMGKEMKSYSIAILIDAVRVEAVMKGQKSSTQVAVQTEPQTSYQEKSTDFSNSGFFFFPWIETTASIP